MNKLLSVGLGVALVVGLSGQYIYYKLSGEGTLTNYNVHDVTRVFNKVIKHNKYLVTPRPNAKVVVRVSGATYFNAYVYEEKNKHTGVITVYVTVTRGLLEFVESEDQLAVVLGHEWTHHLNGDIRGKWVPKESERVADLAGAWMATQAGYDACHGKDMWSKLKKYAGNDGHSESHPNFSQRVDSLQCVNSYKTNIRVKWIDTNRFREYVINKSTGWTSK